MLVKNLVPQEMVDNAIKIIDSSFHKVKSIGFINDPQVTNRSTMSWDDLLKDIHEYIQPILEDRFDTKLKKTKNYGRIYTKHAYLENHRDGWHCEYSATVNLLNLPDGVWPFSVSKDNKTWIDYEMEPGDGVLYKGEELWHKRGPLQYDECYQWFFHYIGENGQYDNLDYFQKKYN